MRCTIFSTVYVVRWVHEMLGRLEKEHEKEVVPAALEMAMMDASRVSIKTSSGIHYLPFTIVIDMR